MSYFDASGASGRGAAASIARANLTQPSLAKRNIANLRRLGFDIEEGDAVTAIYQGKLELNFHRDRINPTDVTHISIKRGKSILTIQKPGSMSAPRAASAAAAWTEPRPVAAAAVAPSRSEDDDLATAKSEILAQLMQQGFEFEPSDEILTLRINQRRVDPYHIAIGGIDFSLVTKVRVQRGDDVVRVEKPHHPRSAPRSAVAGAAAVGPATHPVWVPTPPPSELPAAANTHDGAAGHAAAQAAPAALDASHDLPTALLPFTAPNAITPTAPGTPNYSIIHSVIHILQKHNSDNGDTKDSFRHTSFYLRDLAIGLQRSILANQDEFFTTIASEMERLKSVALFHPDFIGFLLGAAKPEIVKDLTAKLSGEY